MNGLKTALTNLPQQLILKKDYIDVYYVNLDQKLSHDYLSKDEEQRANRFKFEHLKHRFLITRNILRILLGKYLSLHPSQIIFNYSEKGKPSLAKNCNYLGLEFNISHSENFALYGFTINRQIGVDIEKIRTINNIEQITQRFFHQRECELISNLNSQEKKQKFFQFWTAKEAYLKAIGTGISGGLDTIEISNSKLKINNQNLDNWQLYNLNIDTKYQASLVVESTEKLPLNLRELDFR